MQGKVILFIHCLTLLMNGFTGPHPDGAKIISIPFCRYRLRTLGPHRDVMALK